MYTNCAVSCKSWCCVLLLLLLLMMQPESFEKKGRLLPRPVKAWPPRENNKYDSVGQLPPIKQLPGGAAAVVNM